MARQYRCADLLIIERARIWRAREGAMPSDLVRLVAQMVTRKVIADI